MAMFREEKTATPSGHPVTTVIGRGILAEGNIGGEGDLVVEGKIKGNISTNGSVRVGKDAEVHADIQASAVHISGSVHGNIQAASVVEITETGKVWGDIRTKTMSVVSGAFFQGSCAMGEGAAPHGTKK